MDKFRDFARPPQVKNHLIAEAGLLTYPLPMPSQLSLLRGLPLRVSDKDFRQ